MRGIVLHSDNVVHEAKEKRFDELPFDMRKNLWYGSVCLY